MLISAYGGHTCINISSLMLVCLFQQLKNSKEKHSLNTTTGSKLQVALLMLTGVSVRLCQYNSWKLNLEYELTTEPKTLIQLMLKLFLHHSHY